MFWSILSFKNGKVSTQFVSVFEIRHVTQNLRFWFQCRKCDPKRDKSFFTIYKLTTYNLWITLLKSQRRNTRPWVGYSTSTNVISQWLSLLLMAIMVFEDGLCSLWCTSADKGHTRIDIALTHIKDKWCRYHPLGWLCYRGSTTINWLIGVDFKAVIT